MANNGVEIIMESSSRDAGLLPGSPDLRHLASASQGAWLEFRKTLRPDYFLAWSELLLCISLMLLGFGGHLFITHIYGNVVGLAVGLPFAVWIGFWMQSLLTFGHEAAHYNLASAKDRNDFCADWTIWLFFPQSTNSYRRSHWQHHLHLGDHQDTEISYHNCLSPWFLSKAVSGIYLLETAARYFFRTPSATKSNSSAASVSVLPIARAMIVHASFVGVAIALGSYSTAIVWIAAVVVVFPFLASVRQILEHRAATAPCDLDFTRELHGPVNRLFGSDIFSRFFGAAGFNRHLLHHWDPTVSYTCFEDMQDFFADTELRTWIEASRSTYLSTMATLLKTALRNGR